MEQNQHPEYEPPEVTTYTDQEILEELGPAQTLYPGGSGPNVM